MQQMTCDESKRAHPRAKCSTACTSFREHVEGVSLELHGVRRPIVGPQTQAHMFKSVDVATELKLVELSSLESFEVRSTSGGKYNFPIA